VLFSFAIQPLSEPDKLSEISQVLEKSRENFTIRLTLSFSKQLVSHDNA